MQVNILPNFGIKKMGVGCYFSAPVFFIFVSLFPRITGALFNQKILVVRPCKSPEIL